MVDQQEASLSRGSSEEERKPTVSPANEPPTSTRLLVVNPKAIFGSDQPFPQHLADLLEEWHKENGTGRPPCNTKQPRRTKGAWKTFDRQGKHLELSAYTIKGPATYNVLVLHTADGSERLVGSYFPFTTVYGTFLKGWLGVHGGWDPTPCAVRKFSNTPDDLSYEPEVWNAFEVLEMRRNKTQALTSGASGQRRSLPGPSQMQRQEPRPQRKSLPGPMVATNDRRDNIAPDTSSSSAEEESDEDDDTSSESSSDEEPEPTSAPKRRRMNEPSVPTHRDPKVVFKLFSYKSGAVRCFPLDECPTGKGFFDKARAFFQLFDRNAEVKILSCQIASQPLQQYIFEGSEGEFALLVDQVKSLAGDGALTVEVSHVLSLH
ncbi:hypothetical protein BDV36DRAFT_98902 [Aspergillus pseudocaelatus]|uniref:Uncharacterized protein n=1 Tax=Aspergillus pseudocaelatus TaxID=1825620 RepID=A0ABQ6W4T1_9EURO|nr:hypothetical protein BDV36DRAFT_98902 [Aspergillus pseudocaelatus]